MHQTPLFSAKQMLLLAQVRYNDEFFDSKLFVSILIGEDNRLINHEVYQDVVRGTAENSCMTDTDMTET